MSTPNFPKAITPPETSVTYLSESMINNALKLSKESPRKRIIYPLHKTNENTLHRMFNVLQPKTYICPHNHVSDNKSESIVVLKGAICFITYNSTGDVLTYQNIKAGTEIFGVDLEPDTIHSFVVLEEDTVIYEAKPGPYVLSSDKDFFTWAPDEGTPEALKFVEQMEELTQNK